MQPREKQHATSFIEYYVRSGVCMRIKALGVLAAFFCLLSISPTADAHQGGMRLRPADARLLIQMSGRWPCAGIQFDDGHVTQYTRARPILMQYGLIGSFGIITGNTDVSPSAMTTDMLRELVLLGHQFQDHTKTHNALEWGDPVYAWQWPIDIAFSQSMFARVDASLSPMVAWNQPGGPGEGFTAQLRDTLKAYGYKRAAGRVGLTGGQQKNLHYGLIDDPFSLGRGVYSWTWNAPAAALEAAGIDPCSREGQHMLEAASSGIMHDTDQLATLLSRCDPQEACLANVIVAT